MMAREDFFIKRTLGQRPGSSKEVGINEFWRNNVPSKGNSKWKGPEVGMGLSYSRDILKEVWLEQHERGTELGSKM